MPGGVVSSNVRKINAFHKVVCKEALVAFPFGIAFVLMATVSDGRTPLASGRMGSRRSLLPRDGLKS
jgi:hypothetical protein